MKDWWKYAGMLLVLISLLGGLLTPLKVSITQVSPYNVKAGETQTLEVAIYNPGPSMQVDKLYFKNELAAFEASEIVSADEGIAQAAVAVPANVGADSSTFDAYAKVNGIWSKLNFAIRVYNNNDSVAIAAATTLNDEDKLSLSNGAFPFLTLLYESIRNLVFHVPLWFSMIALLGASSWYSIKYLRNPSLETDARIYSLVSVAILAGILGCITGAVWAKVTWGGYWPKEDPKLQGVAIGMFMYFAYLLLRNAIPDPHQKARISALYNLFIFPIFIALIAIMPKLSPTSLHPGTGGTVGFNQYDMNNTLRMFFYPAVAGWIIIFAWIASLTYKLEKRKLK